MKFLDSEILYPDEEAEGFDEEKNKQDILSIWEKYNEYLNQCKSKIDKELLSLYKKTDFFHDYIVHDIDFQTRKNDFSKAKKDEIILTFQGNDSEIIHLILKDIVRFKMDYNQLDRVEEEKFGLEAISLCEIGYEYNYSFINLFMVWSNAEISIYFKTAKYEIEKYKK